MGILALGVLPRFSQGGRRRSDDELMTCQVAVGAAHCARPI